MKEPIRNCPFCGAAGHFVAGDTIECTNTRCEANHWSNQWQNRTPGPATVDMLLLAHAMTAMDQLPRLAIQASQAFIDEWSNPHEQA